MRSGVDSIQLTKALTDYHLVYRNFFRNIIKPEKMPVTQYHILSVLQERPNIRMGEISQIMSISRPNLTPLIDKLVALNYVERVSDTNDRRVTYISLTALGKKVFNSEKKTINDHIATVCSKMTEQELLSFGNALNTLTSLSKKL